MRFSLECRTRALAATGLLPIVLGACGVLGDKEDPPKSVVVSSPTDACMNDFGNRAKAFMRGEISESEWSGTWKCFSDALSQFKEVVHGSDPRGYTREDMQAFSSQFLVTDQDVSPELVDATFYLKAAAIGGSPDVITPAEIDRATALLSQFATSTVALIPHFKTWTTGSTPASILGFTDALIATGRSLATLMTPSDEEDRLATLPFSKVELFFSELNRLHGLGFPVDLLPLGARAKAFLLGGSDQDVESGMLPTLIETAISVFSSALAIVEMPESKHASQEEYHAFLLDLSSRVFDVLKPAAKRHGGSLPMQSLTALLETIPTSWAPIDVAQVEALLGPGKALFLGGSGDVFEETEWEEFLDLARSMFHPVLDHLANYRASDTVAGRVAVIEQFFAQVQPTLTELAAKNGGSIDFVRVNSFVGNLPQAWLPVAGSTVTDVYPSLKRLLVGGSALRATESEWERFITMTGEALDPVLILALTDPNTMSAEAYARLSVEQLARVRDVIERYPVPDTDEIPLSMETVVKIVGAIPDSAFTASLSRSELLGLLRPLKTLIAGGNPESFTHSEWRSVLATALALSKPALDFAYVLPTAGSTADWITGTLSIAKSLRDALEPIAGRLGGRIDFSLLDALIDALDDTWIAPLTKDRLKAYYPVFKYLLTGGDTRSFSQTEWALFLDQIVSGLEPALRIFYADPAQLGTVGYANYVIDQLQRIRPLFDRVVEAGASAQPRSLAGLFGPLPLAGITAPTSISPVASASAKPEPEFELSLVTSVLDYVPADTYSSLLSRAELEGMLGPVKEFLVAGSATAFTYPEWKNLFDTWLAIAPNLTLLSNENPVSRPTLVSAIHGIAEALRPVVGRHGQSLSMNVVDRLIQAVPDRLFPLAKPDLLKLVPLGKQLLVAGSDRRVTTQEWSALLTIVEESSDPALTIYFTNAPSLSGSNAYGEFLLAQAQRLRLTFKQIIDQHKGRIRLTLFDSLIDALPADWITIDREAIKLTLRPATHRLLGATTDRGFEQVCIDSIFAWWEEWTKRQTHLEEIFRIFALDPLGVSTERFATSAQSYTGLVDTTEVRRIESMIQLARDYRPLFAGDDAQITFTTWTRHSLNDLSRLIIYERIVERLLYAYSSSPNHDQGSLDDLKQMLDDYDELGYALRFINPIAASLADRRHREADLFMFSSDGDGFISLQEGTYYVAFLASAKTLSRRILNDFEPLCADPAAGQDSLGWDWMSIKCFREKLYSQFEHYWDYMPHLVEFWQALSDEERKEMIEAIEKGGRKCGYSDLPIASYDIEGLSGLLQYIEALFARYDEDDNQELSVDEAEIAFPVFKNTIATLGDIDPSKDGMLEAAFTYMLKYETIPEKNVCGTAHFLWWWARKPFWKIHADRKAVYNIISMLATPASSDPTQVQPECVNE